MLNVYTCCFIGHRKIEENENLRSNLYKTVDTFLFGSKSEFNYLCYEIVSELKEKHPHIKRIYVRAEYPYINEDYKKYLLKYYEDTYYPEAVLGANRAVYVKRNCVMIDKSDFCIVYYNEKFTPKKRKSGTKLALDYAVKKKREIIIFS